MTFHRTELAQGMAQQLLKPTFLDMSLRSGLFLSGQRRVGKTTFLASDLIPALERMGAIVIYVDLWSQPQANPADLVHDAICRALDDLQKPGSGILQKLKHVSAIEAGVAGFKFGFKLAEVGKEGGVSLALAPILVLAPNPGCRNLACIGPAGLHFAQSDVGRNPSVGQSRALRSLAHAPGRRPPCQTTATHPMGDWPRKKTRL